MRGTASQPLSSLLEIRSGLSGALLAYDCGIRTECGHLNGISKFSSLSLVQLFDFVKKWTT